MNMNTGDQVAQTQELTDTWKEEDGIGREISPCWVVCVSL